MLPPRSTVHVLLLSENNFIKIRLNIAMVMNWQIMMGMSILIPTIINIRMLGLPPSSHGPSQHHIGGESGRELCLHHCSNGDVMHAEKVL